MKIMHDYLKNLWHPDGSPAIIARDMVCDAQELPGGYVELIEYGGRRHTIKADKAQKRELLASVKGWRKLNR